MPRYGANKDRLREDVCQVVEMVCDKLEERFSIGALNRLIRFVWILSVTVLSLSIVVLVTTLISQI